MKKASSKSEAERIDEETLRAFAKGQLDEATEDEIVALLDRNPELQAKVAAVSIAPVVEKMRVHSQVVVEKSLSSQLGETSADRSPNTSESIDVPAELEALSEFRIIRELGRGGMGVVYLAENTWMGNRKEVLKVLNEKLVDSGDAKERFQQEIEVTAALDHPSIVKSHSVRPLKSVVVFSMEYVKGKDLHAFISENGRLPVHVACSIAVDVCEGLQHAMKKGAIHRDIKPSNIMLYKDDNRHIRAKILDFGLARRGTQDRTQGLTEYGSLLGTLEYISPEQSLNAADVDIRTDIYSLGCTVYHMLVGHPPFSGSPGELIMAHSQKIPPTVNMVQPTVPKAVGEVVARMLAKQKDRRYQQPQQIAEALKPFVSQKEIRRPVRPAPDTSGPTKAALRDTSIVHRPPSLSAQPSPSSMPHTGAPNPANPLLAIRVEPKSVLLERKLARRPRKAKLPKPVLIGIPIIAVIAVIIAILASGVMRIRTENGTIVFQNLPDDAEVFVDGDKVELKWNGEKALIVAAVGERKVSIHSEGGELERRTINVPTGREAPMVIATQPSERNVTNEVQVPDENFLANPSCEEDSFVGSIAGWTCTTGTWHVAETANHTKPPHGTRCFHPGACKLAQLEQQIDLREFAALLDSGKLYYKAHAKVCTLSQPVCDTCEFTVEFIDVDRLVIAKYTSGEVISRNRWRKVQNGGRVPPLTRFAVVRLIGRRPKYRNNNAAFDDVGLYLERSLAPEGGISVNEP